MEGKYDIYNELVKSSILYEAEMWRVKKQNKGKLEALTMDVLRISTRIPPRVRISSEIIRKKMEAQRTLFRGIERKHFISYGRVQWMWNERTFEEVDTVGSSLSSETVKSKEILIRSRIKSHEWARLSGWKVE